MDVEAKQLLKLIHEKIISIRPGMPDEQIRMWNGIKKWFIPNLTDIISTNFKSKKRILAELINIGGSSVVIRLAHRLFRITYIEPTKDEEVKTSYQMNVLMNHDFGILAPIDYHVVVHDPKHHAQGLWWYEIEEAYPYQGATLKEYSVLLHKVLKLAKYNLFWNDIHNDNFMRDKNGKLVIVDFDTGSVDEYVKGNIAKFKNTKRLDIEPWLDHYIPGPREIWRLRSMIFAYLKIPITNENWMKFCFGEYMYRNKYIIEWRYPTILFEEQIKHKGAIPF